VWASEPHGKWVRFQPDVISPLHTHTQPYHGVVIQGTVINPYAGEEEPRRMGPGTYWHVPAGAVHATGCVSEEPCLFYTHGDALWDIEIVEAAEGAGAD
jgi:quercetin dioxygenase-like cupin family protein